MRTMERGGERQPRPLTHSLTAIPRMAALNCGAESSFVVAVSHAAFEGRPKEAAAADGEKLVQMSATTETSTLGVVRPPVYRVADHLVDLHFVAIRERCSCYPTWQY